MKNVFKEIIKCMAVLCGLFLIIHRRVIAAALTGTEMPEAPDWHKKFLVRSPKGEEE